MATKLIPIDQKIYKWKLPEDREDPEACVFHFIVRSNKHRIETNLLKAVKLIDSVEDFANDVYGDNIQQIDNVDGKTLKDRNDIVDFCINRLSENQGAALQLAIQQVGDWLERGLVKN